MCSGVLKIRFPTLTSKCNFFYHSKLKTLISHLAFYIFKSPGPGWIVQRQTLRSVRLISLDKNFPSQFGKSILTHFVKQY